MKKHVWYQYLFPVMFVGLSALILVEGATPGNESGSQSKKLASIFDFGPKVAPVVNPESLSVEGNTVLHLGEKLTYTPHFVPENTTDQRVEYQVLGDTDAVELQNDTLIGKKDGKITLKITSLAFPSIEATMDIQVERMKLTSLESRLSTDSQLITGMTSRLTVEGNTADFSLDDVCFHSSDESILTIDDLGYIRTKKEGTAMVYASSQEEASVHSEPILITVRPGEFVAPTSISMPEELTLFVKEKFEVPVTFSDGSSDLNYQLSGKGLTVLNDMVFASVAGDYQLQATAIYDSEITASSVIHVRKAEAKEIRVSSSSIQYGNTVSLDYSLVSEKEGVPVTDEAVLFESSDASIATIDEKGNIIGKKKGNVDVTVRWKENPEICGKANITITSLEGEKFDLMNFWVRKLIGHFGLFFVTGACGFLTVLFFFFDGKKKYILSAVSAVYGFILAMFSELFQVWAGGRTPSWRDVGIDTSGYVIATLIGVLILCLILWHKNKHPKETEKTEQKNLGN